MTDTIKQRPLAGKVIRAKLDALLSQVATYQREIKAREWAIDEAKAQILKLNERYRFDDPTEASEFYRTAQGTVQVTRPKAPAPTLNGRKLLDVMLRKIELPDEAREIFCDVIRIRSCCLDEERWGFYATEGRVQDRWLLEAMDERAAPKPSVKVTVRE